MTKEEAWAAFAEQYNHRLHGPSDAFKFAWKAATEAEREACIVDIQMHIPRSGRDTLEYKMAMRMLERIRARGEA